MKIRIVDSHVEEGHKWETVLASLRCVGTGCEKCPFRFRCFTEGEVLTIERTELDDLAISSLSGNWLIDLINLKPSDSYYYELIFRKLTSVSIVD